MPGFCKISRSALQFSSRTKAMGILWFIFIFISLICHGKIRKAKRGKQRYLRKGIIFPHCVINQNNIGSEGERCPQVSERDTGSDTLERMHDLIPWDNRNIIREDAVEMRHLTAFLAADGLEKP